MAAYDGDGATVGFARAVSDGVDFAYLADVYVEAAARGAGLGTALVRAMIEDGPGPRLPLDAVHERRARPVRPLRLRGTGRDGDGAPAPHRRERRLRLRQATGAHAPRGAAAIRIRRALAISPGGPRAG